MLPRSNPHFRPVLIMGTGLRTGLTCDNAKTTPESARISIVDQDRAIEKCRSDPLKVSIGDPDRTIEGKTCPEDQDRSGVIAGQTCPGQVCGQVLVAYDLDLSPPPP